MIVYFQSIRNSSQNSGECLVDRAGGGGGPEVVPSDCTLSPPPTDTSPVTLAFVGKKRGQEKTPGIQKAGLGEGVQVVSGYPSCHRPQEKNKLFPQERITKMTLTPVCLFKK